VLRMEEVDNRRQALGGGLSVCALGGRGRPAALLEEEEARLEDEDNRWRALGGGGRPTVLRAEEVNDRRCCVQRKTVAGFFRDPDPKVVGDGVVDKRPSWWACIGLCLFYASGRRARGDSVSN
jgi:hypothetical protein